MSAVDNLVNFFNKAIAPTRRKVLLMVGRAIITAVKDSTDIQQVQVKLFAGEVKDDVERFQEYGLRSFPPDETEAIMVCVGGNREHGVIIATENRAAKSSIPPLAKGDVALYNNQGASIHLSGEDIKVKLDKFSVTNDTEELIAVLSEFMEEVIKGLNETVIGPMPLTAATQVAMTLVKDKLDTFKV